MTTGHTAPDHGKSRIARTIEEAKIFSKSLPFVEVFTPEGIGTVITKEPVL